MVTTGRERAIRGIILKKVLYRETSLILDFFSRSEGRVSMLAKGSRGEKSRHTGLLELLNELEAVVYMNRESSWIIFKSAELIKSHLYEVNFQTSTLLQAAAELYLQLEIPKEEATPFYDLLISYLDFVARTHHHGMLVFWRFLLRLCKLLGLDIDPEYCVLCGEKSSSMAGFYPHKSGFICLKCFKPVLEPLLLTLDSKTALILANIKHINDELTEMEIDQRNMEQLNRIFLTHLEQHFHKKFHLKSLSLKYNQSKH